MKYIILFIGACLSLHACKPQISKFETLPPLSRALQCMPEPGAIIAAHRGTSRNWPTPENSISGLNKLIKENYLIAEIDVARLGDGTLITFHDGIWDDISTGKGPIAASSRSDLDKVLLKTRRGKLTNDRPPFFEDMLTIAKNKIYLEIDFKSSVNMETVINTIHNHQMDKHVILIAYTAKQAKQLRKLAPNMVLSIPDDVAIGQKTYQGNIQGPQTGNLVWLGRDVIELETVRPIKRAGHYIIGRAGEASKTKYLKEIRRNADIIVTDYPEQYLPLTGLDKAQHKSFENCLNQMEDKG